MLPPPPPPLAAAADATSAAAAALRLRPLQAAADAPAGAKALPTAVRISPGLAPPAEVGGGDRRCIENGRFGAVSFCGAEVTSVLARARCCCCCLLRRGVDAEL